MWAELRYRGPFGPAWQTVHGSNLMWWIETWSFCVSWIFWTADRLGPECGPSSVQIFCIAYRPGSRCGPSTIQISANVQSQQHFDFARFYVSRTIRPWGANHSKVIFECSDIFIAIYSRWDSCADDPGLNCRPSACEKRGNWPIMASFGEGAIYILSLPWLKRSRRPFGTLVSVLEPLLSSLSHSYWLGLHSSEIESHLVHCIMLLIFEALGR
jgi:hypothetical protein